MGRKKAVVEAALEAATAKDAAEVNGKPKADLPDGFLTSSQLRAEKLPISEQTLASWRKAGKIPYIQLNRKTLYHWPSVQSALLRQMRGGQL